MHFVSVSRCTTYMVIKMLKKKVATLKNNLPFLYSIFINWPFSTNYLFHLTKLLIFFPTIFQLRVRAFLRTLVPSDLDGSKVIKSIKFIFQCSSTGWGPHPRYFKLHKNLVFQRQLNYSLIYRKLISIKYMCFVLFNGAATKKVSLKIENNNI